MKIETAPPEVEASADFESMMMGIGDPVMIMKFLRNNLYSNKIGIVVQEYMSNARDAHREVGIPDRQIEVSLPSRLEPRFKIRDFGPGIDAERMRTAFTQYGVSTKNTSNDQTGGFGIGCMSGFSYNDSFIVIVIIDRKDLDEPFLESYIEESGIDRLLLQSEEWIPNTKMKTDWVCFIDKTEAGEVSKVSEALTIEEPGTSIIVPCKKGDRQEFRSQVQRVAKWWDPQPIVHSDSFYFPKIDKEFISASGKWCIQTKVGRWDDDPRDKPRAILDGIPYPLNLEAIYPRKDVESASDEIFGVEEDLPSPIPQYATELFMTPLRMYLSTGEVSVAVNREALDYGEKTRKTLRDRIEEAHKEIQAEIASKLGEADSLWEACIAWGRIKEQFIFIKTSAEWKGHKLVSKVSIPTKFSSYDRPSLKDRTRVYKYDQMLCGDWELAKEDRGKQQWEDRVLNILDDTLLVEDDTDCNLPPKTRMRTIYKQAEAEGKKRVVVVKIATEEHRKTLFKRIDWEALNPIKLASIPKTLLKFSGVPVKVSKARNINGNSVEIDIINGDGVYVAQYKGKFIGDPVGFQGTRSFGSSYVLTQDELYSYQNKWGIKVVVVLERYVKKMGAKWVPFLDYARERIKMDLEKPEILEFLDYIEDYSFAYNSGGDYAHLNIFWSNYGSNSKKWIKGRENSDLIKWLEISEKFRQVSGDISRCRSLARIFGVDVRPPTISVKELRDRVDAKYGNVGKIMKSANNVYGIKTEVYYEQFEKYLTFIELERTLGEKS